jgi:beta-galactosidase
MKLRLLLTLVVCGSALAAPTTRSSFDTGWKFARFGAMPDGSTRPEPGVPSEMITASTHEAGNPASNAIDGDKSTRWCASGQLNDQALTLDLGRSEKLGGLQIIWEKDTQNPFSVQVSETGGDWREVAPKRPADGDEETVKFTATARYIRLTADSASAAWASVREMEVLDSQGNKITPRPANSDKVAAKPEHPTFMDSDWRSLDLPHDWAIEGPFRMDIENETGKLPWVGIGWYRKTFDLPASAAGQRVYLDFDGAMAQPKIYINGVFAGEWKYGYSSFRIDLTNHLKLGKNTLAVRLENLPVSTRWYPGAGLYRHVWWVQAPPTHIAHWGVQVTTPEITDKAATVRAVTTVANHSDKPSNLTVRQEILDDGMAVARTETSLTVAASAEASGETELKVPNPKRWDIKSPTLYALRTRILDGDAIIDEKLTTFGIREIAWDAQKGFLLNGRKVVLKGVCNHHDLGPLGAAAYTRGMERQIEILQEMGCNSIRTAHNPPAPAFLDLCDRMGILVIDELFDIWKMQKYGKSNGYNIYWDDWAEKDTRNFIMRDRNHPSIIAWSGGNEISELSTPSMHWVPAKLKEWMNKYDGTRIVTAGSNAPAATTNGFQKTVDAYGVNYHLGSYDATEKALPDMPLYASETSSTVSTRGEYYFPVDWDKSKGFYNFQVSSYDLYAPGWANRPDLQFEALDKHPRFAGEYVWTGFDYLGEPTPYNQDQTNALNFSDPEERAKAMQELKRLGNRAPSRSSYFGILDLCGFRKDRFYIYQARWLPELPMAHILPHWNWNGREGEITPVHVYTSGDEAELFLNGKSLGKRQVGKPNAYRLVWDDVKYQPGKLEVIVTKDSKPWAKDVRETTGFPAKLELKADRVEIAGDGQDLSYLTLRILDAKDREVPDADSPLHIRVTGPIEIIGICNGDPTDFTTMKPADPTQAEIPAFNGMAQVVVRGKRAEAGSALVEIASKGLGTAKATVTVKGN